MSKKRFKLIGDSNLAILMQHQLKLPIYDSYQNNKRLSLSNVLDLLNSFNDENEQLKQENKLKGDFREFVTKDIQKIKEENDQLKSEVEFWKKQTKQCPMRGCKND